ncbi:MULTISPECIES: YceI family protein [unclassified Polaribacter]|uniref:YceI family protein n=1 Tax=unclassified Polaribacter TaxID=196858 RepID=UPI0011BFCA4E|nr:MULTISPECIES: YceI family protein [unclassified Polaribacter]TXD52818.1 YceI family protein [Polaribacter sp. IC063]TXD61695.1 YceI family protein [Polaribacter sp. IC066]
MNRLITLNSTLFVLLFFTLTGFSQESTKNKNKSAITFIIKNFGFNVDGNFKTFSVSSNFDAQRLKESFFNAEIQVNSIFTDSKSRDAHLLEEDYFDVKKYPKMIFQSTAIEEIANFKYILKGFITIKGIKKRVETPLAITTLKESTVFKANFELDRKDFNVGGSSLVLSNTVDIKMIYVADRN